MRLRKLVVIAIVVSLLLAVVLIKKEARQEASCRQEKLVVREVELIQDIPEEQISRIIVYKGEDAGKRLIILRKRSDGQWVLENKYGLKARQDSIQDILGRLKGLKGELRAESKELFPDFQIQDFQAAHILLESKEEKTPAHLLVSYLKPEWNKNFARLADSDKVTLVPKDILSVFQLYNKDSAPDGIFLADTKLVSFDPAGIQKIEISRAKESFVLKKIQPQGDASAHWQCDPPLGKKEEIDLNRVNELVQALSNIHIKDALDPQQATYGFEQPTLKLALEDVKGEKPVQLVIGNFMENEKCYFVKDMVTSLVFKVPDHYFQKINLAKSAFIKPREKKTNAKPAK